MPAKYKQIRLAADGVIKAGPCTIMAVLAQGTNADWACAYHNDVDSAGGTTVLDIGGQAEGGQTYFDFTNIGGVEFTIGCFLNLTVTSGIIYTWID